MLGLHFTVHLASIAGFNLGRTVCWSEQVEESLRKAKESETLTQVGPHTAVHVVGTRHATVCEGLIRAHLAGTSPCHRRNQQSCE